MQRISSTSVFLNSSGCTSAERRWWSHLLQAAQRHAAPFLFVVNNGTALERAFCISRPDHQSLPLSPPFPRSPSAPSLAPLAELILGLKGSSLHLDAWCFRRVSQLRARRYDFLFATSLTRSRAKKFWPWNWMWQHQKKRPKFCLRAKTLIFPEREGMKRSPRNSTFLENFLCSFLQQNWLQIFPTIIVFLFCNS